MPLTSCNTWESSPCASSEQHNRANLVGRRVGEPALKLYTERTVPTTCLSAGSV